MTKKAEQVTDTREIRKILKTDVIKNLNLEIRSKEEIKSGLVELSKEEIIEQIFDGRANIANTLLKGMERRPEIKVFSSTKDDFFRVEVPSWNGVDNYSMIIEYDIDSIRRQSASSAEDIWIINRETNQGFSIKSFYPPLETDNFKNLVFYRAFQNEEDEVSKQKVKKKNKEWFATGNVMGVGEALMVGEIHDNESLSIVFHELGHYWASFLEIDTGDTRKWKNKRANLKKLFQDGESDELLKIVKEKGFGERMANIIGRLLSNKLNGTGFLPEGDSFKYDESSESSSSYDVGHAQYHLSIYDEVKSSFVGRENRTKKGKETMKLLDKWIKKKLFEIALLIDKNYELKSTKIEENGDTKSRYEGKMEKSFSILKDQNEKVLEVSGRFPNLKSNFSISLFSGITFTNNFYKKEATTEIMIGQLWDGDVRAEDEIEKFESFISELMA